MSEKIPAGINTTIGMWNYVFSSETRARLAELLEFDESLIPAESSEGAMIPSVRGARVIVGTWGALPYTPRLLDACPDLELILYSAGAFKSYVTDALIERGITVGTSVHLNAVPTAEYTMGIILTSLKNVFAYQQAFLEHGRAAFQVDREGFNGGYFRTKLGLVGWGQISRHLLKLLRPFDMDVYVSSSYITPEEEQAHGVAKKPLEWLMANCDVISLHAADVERNWGIINRDTLALMKPGARLINTARGRLINEDALVEKLRQGEISAYLDVTHPEPPEEGHPFYSLPNCILTPHVAGSIGTEVHRMGEYSVRELENWMAGRPLENELDIADQGERA